MIDSEGMAIELEHYTEKRRHSTASHNSKHFAKSISTDGTEGKLTKNIQQQVKGYKYGKFISTFLKIITLAGIAANNNSWIFFQKWKIVNYLFATFVVVMLFRIVNIVLFS